MAHGLCIRAKDGNFGWGYLYGLFIVFFTSIEEWIKDIKVLVSEGYNRKYGLKSTVETIALLTHFTFGVHYLQLLFNGFDYK